MSHSLSKYLCKNIAYGHDVETDFHSANCMHRNCSGQCDILETMGDLKNELNCDKKVIYYVFKTTETQYYKKNSKLVLHTRTARVDNRDSIKNIIKQLQSQVQKYLLDCFFFINHKVDWEKFLQSIEHYMPLLDFARNIAFKEKSQV